MEIFKNKYQKITFEPENKILYIEWFNSNEDMTDKEYKDASIAVPSYAKKQGAIRILNNAINSLFIVTPKTQDWVNKNSVPKYLEAGILKLAILLPSDIFTQVSVEQIIDDSVEIAQQRIQYFESEKKALKWLLE